MSQVYDYECRAEKSNVHQNFSHVPFFPDNMLFQNFRAPPNLSNLLIFLEIMIFELPELVGTPEIFTCPVFSG